MGSESETKKTDKVAGTGCCPTCGRAWDDHDGLVADKPRCPKKRK